VSDWKTICRVDDIPRLGARKVTRKDGGDIAIFRTADDRVFALLDRCPHKGGPLSQGIVFGDSVACPLHNWTIGLVDGCAAAPDVGCAPRFSVRVEGGGVALDLAELKARERDLDPDTTNRVRAASDASASVEAPAKAAA
jgi:nitrite reductase [NAD(P)H] small subunit